MPVTPFFGFPSPGPGVMILRLTTDDYVSVSHPSEVAPSPSDIFCASLVHIQYLLDYCDTNQIIVAVNVHIRVSHHTLPSPKHS